MLITVLMLCTKWPATAFFWLRTWLFAGTEYLFMEAMAALKCLDLSLHSNLRANLLQPEVL